jgi:hypothetical protein
METQNNRFKRMLLIILIILYLVTISAFSYANWASDPAFMTWWKTLLNIPILSIPLVLLYGSIYVLVIAWRAHSAQEQIDPRLAKIIHWAPRAAAILIIFFISLFSLDVFETQATPLELLGGFLIHNIPSIVLLVLLIVAWKRPAVGFVAFLAAGVLFAVFFIRDLSALPSLLLFVLPILLISFLFFADWKWLTPIQNAQTGVI